jgi:predicted RecA/RadA family phage recombinase
MKTSKILGLLALASLSLLAMAAQATGTNILSILPADTMAGLAMVGAAGITTYKQEGERLSLAPGADVASGVGYLFGVSLFGVALGPVTSGATGEFLTEGVVTIGKTSALAIAVGDRVFWDATNKVVNKTTTSQQCVGVAVEAAANPSSTVIIKLGGIPAVAA